MSLVWISDFETGIASIDRQHQKLFDHINRLESYINLNIFEGEDIEELFRFLTDYVVMHFSHEEFCMKNASCPVAKKNKLAHNMFIKTFNELKDEYWNSDSETRVSVIQKLQRITEDWLTNHICKIDIQLKNSTSMN